MWDLETIIKWLVIAAAALTALGVIWKKAGKPLWDFITSANEMLPLLRELVVVFRDTPGAFLVLEDIAKQFRTDSGSSLRDVVNRLELGAIEAKAAAELIRVRLEAGALLSERDREQLMRLLILLDRLDVKVEAAGVDRAALTESSKRIEAGVKAAQSNLAQEATSERIETAVNIVVDKTIESETEKAKEKE